MHTLSELRFTTTVYIVAVPSPIPADVPGRSSLFIHAFYTIAQDNLTMLADPALILLVFTWTRAVESLYEVPHSYCLIG